MLKILIITDRQREAIINGEDVPVQEYKCNECKKWFTITAETSVKYCPCCGVKYDDMEDHSA